MRAITKPEKVPTELRWREDIKCHNRTRNLLVLPTKQADYQIRVDAGGYMLLSWPELEWVNMKTSVIKEGVIEFDESESDEIYRALRIFDTENILFESVLLDILMHPTIQNMQRIIEITNVRTLDRLRCKMQELIYEGVEFSSKLYDCIEGRRKELAKGRVKSKIQLVPIKDTAPAQQSEVEELKAMLAAQSAQIAQLIAAQQQPESKPVKTATTKTKKDVNGGQNE